MYIGRNLFVSCVWFSTTMVSAASIKSADADGNAPFSIVRQQSDESPFSIVLQISNSGPELIVAIWQLQLELRSEATALGALRISNVFSPPMSLFGDSPGPISDLVLPDVHVNVFDGDLFGGGQVVPEQAARNIVGVEFDPAPGTSGTFQLVMPEFNPSTPTVGSSILPFGAFDPVPFDNDSPSDFGGYVLLGTFTFSEVPEPAAITLFLICALIGLILIRTREFAATSG